jgi:lauroyl/myristoyl acyltransferase
VLVDQHAGDHGVWSPLFDRLASTTTIAALMAMRTVRYCRSVLEGRGN